MDYSHLYTGDHKNTILSFDFKVINTIFEFWILLLSINLNHLSFIYKN